MSERKVLNKYYPPDFDPSKIPRMKLARNRQYTVRLMAPFNMRCKTCGEYIYKGKKFNARKEDVEGDDYLGIRIYRFYIKCTRCLQEISFKTDPKNTDYEIEAGATRNFMALKLAEEQAQREEDEEKEQEATNPMKLLEKRTQQSKQELELLESLEELKDLNRRQQTIDYDQMLSQYGNETDRQRAIKEQEELDEEYVKSIFGKKRSTSAIIEEEIVELPSNESSQPLQKLLKTSNNRTPNKQSYVEYNKGKACDVMESYKLENAVTKPIGSRPSSSSWTSSMASPSLCTTSIGLNKKRTILGVKLMSNSISAKTTVESNSTQGTIARDSIGKDAPTTIIETSKVTIPTDKKTKVNGLSLLCLYSDSSDNESD